ncbi:OLC1v1027221C1 [Oldenlandia corymbosa var. corymbosa]|uniref:OLC1v1027221C1 n=1 Tax=Oldenlandia corymbosa var. corymbosa TaxID=529605 RepID=A0AAV1C8Z2_OLDCO|nr:OLC1v1027221C1 [Oldenlandia corymbosa var. corymbosa]
MALILRSPATTSFAIKKLHNPPYLLQCHNLPSIPKHRNLTVKFQDSSSSSSASTSEPSKSTESTTSSSSSAVAPPPPQKKPNSAAGLGFGSSAVSTKTSSPPTVSKKKQKGKRERASVIRRAPLEKPSFAAQNDEGKAKEQSQNESAFLLAWLGLGAIILVQGLVLAASGFLPEEVDRFFAKYLYPTFTPTVGLFVAGTVAYGVLKYLQNENLKNVE